mgnify:CR=1 FL=1
MSNGSPHHNMPHLRKRIHSKKQQLKILLTQMQERSQTQSRQGIHAQMESKKPRTERRAPQTGRPRSPQTTHTPLARTTPRRSESPSQSLPPSKPQNRSFTPAQMAAISPRKGCIQGSLPKVGATQPRNSRRTARTQSQSRSRRQRHTRTHPGKMGGKQQGMPPLRRPHQPRHPIARPNVAYSGAQNPHHARRTTRHRQHQLRPQGMQQQQGSSNHRGVQGTTEASQLGDLNPLAATQQGCERVTSLLKPARNPSAIDA